MYFPGFLGLLFGLFISPSHLFLYHPIGYRSLLQNGTAATFPRLPRVLRVLISKSTPSHLRIFASLHLPRLALACASLTHNSINDGNTSDSASVAAPPAPSSRLFQSTRSHEGPSPFMADCHSSHLDCVQHIPRAQGQKADPEQSVFTRPRSYRDGSTASSKD